MEMLLQLGPHVHTDPLLLAKVLRVGRAFLKDKGGSSSDGGMSQEERVRATVRKEKKCQRVLFCGNVCKVMLVSLDYLLTFSTSQKQSYFLCSCTKKEMTRTHSTKHM